MIKPGGGRPNEETERWGYQGLGGGVHTTGILPHVNNVSLKHH